MPEIRDVSSFDIQGHRGARGLAPENTLPSFRLALESGVTTLELDTVISADHEVVVSHDLWFSSKICCKPNGEPVEEDEEQEYLLYQMPYRDIALFDCGKRGNPDFPRQAPQAAIKPLLREVISFAERYTNEFSRRPVHYNVETKSVPDGDGRLHPSPDTFVELIGHEVDAAGITDRFILQSFDVRTLQAARKLDLPFRLSLLVGSGFHTAIEHLEAGLDELGFVPDIFSPDFHLVTDKVLERVHSDGMQLIPWTVNEAVDMFHLRDMGVDGLITDYPDIAVKELIEGGQK